jgi:hypothetical protein
MMEISIILIIIFIIGVGLTKWLSDRSEHTDFTLEPPFEDDKGKPQKKR